MGRKKELQLQPFAVPWLVDFVEAQDYPKARGHHSKGSLGLGTGHPHSWSCSHLQPWGAAAQLWSLHLDATGPYTSIWEEDCSFDMSSSSLLPRKSISFTWPGENSSWEKTLNISHAPHHRFCTKAFGVPSPSLFPVSAQCYQALHQDMADATDVG